MQSDQRTFYLYDLQLDARKQGASIPSLNEVLHIWTNAFRDSTLYPLFGGDKNMVIGDLRHDANQNFVILLIRISDKSAPNSVYSDVAANTFKEHLKDGDWGADFACHVILSTSPERNKANVYTCAIERVSGLPASYIQRMLSKLLHMEYNTNDKFYEYPAPGAPLKKDGTPRMEKCLPHVEMRGRPSNTLINDINNGKITGITLVRSENVTPVAGAAYLEKQSTEVKLSVNSQIAPGNIWGSLTGFMRREAQNYPTAKIAYKLPNSTKSVTVEFDSVNGHPLEDLYVESFDILRIFPPLSHSTQVILPRVIDPALVQFLQKRNI